MEIEVKTTGDGVRLALAGSIDEQGARELKAHFVRVQDQYLVTIKGIMESDQRHGR